MGVSTNGLLFYGFTFSNTEDGEILGTEDEDVSEALLAKLQAEDEDYFYDATKNDPNIEVDYHCSADYPMHFIAHKKASFTAHRGYPGNIDLKALAALDTAEMDGHLKAF